MRKSCRALVGVGILRESGRRGYRFRHLALSESLARGRLHRLVAGKHLDLLPDPLRIQENDTVDTRLNRQALIDSDALTAYLMSRYPRYMPILVYRYLYLAFGALEPIRAGATVQRFLLTHHGSRAVAATAEVLDMLGHHDAALAKWDEARDPSIFGHSSQDVWVTYRWVRREVQFGSWREARMALSALIAKRPGSRSDMWRVLRAELDVNFGAPQDRAEARDALADLQACGSPYIAGRATLEMARISVEDDDDHASAARLLGLLLNGALGVSALAFARYAQLQWREGRALDARGLAAEGVRLATWGEDPTHQLEAMITALIVAVPDQALALMRARRLLACNWSLRHRAGLRALYEARLGEDSGHSTVILSAFGV